MSNSSVPNTETNTVYGGIKGTSKPDANTTALPVAAAAQAVCAPAITGTASGAFATLADRDALVDLCNAMRTALIAAGIIKGSA
jgi:hypothetical protein